MTVHMEEGREERTVGMERQCQKRRQTGTATLSGKKDGKEMYQLASVDTIHTIAIIEIAGNGGIYRLSGISQH